MLPYVFCTIFDMYSKQLCILKLNGIQLQTDPANTVDRFVQILVMY